MKEKKFDKQKLFTAVITVILVFFFIGGFWLGLDRVRSMEGTFPPNDIKEGLSVAPETAEEAIAFLNRVVADAVKSNAKTDFDGYFSIDSDSLKTDGSDEFNTTLLFVLDNFENHISTVEESEEILSSVQFGEDVSKLLRIPQISDAEVEEFKCSYIYYSCPSCGENNDEQLPNCELCGSEREYFKKYRDEYEIELVLFYYNAPGAQILSKNFAPRTKEQINALTAEKLDGVAKINKTEIDYNTIKIIYKVNRLTDELTSLRFIKEMSVASDVSFIGDYSVLGDKSVSFNVTETHSFGLTWPSLKLNAEELVIEPKKSDNLLATLTCEDPLAMTVTWSSSDESIATVDEEGYINTTKATGETVITASFEYLGKTYSDSCTVYVRVPVESMKMNDKSVSLKIGENVTLSTKVSPSDATVKTVTWYTEDDSIAVVDENGVVTAVGVGEVIVYALSDDGYYRSTCEVKVE